MEHGNERLSQALWYKGLAAHRAGQDSPVPVGSCANGSAAQAQKLRFKYPCTAAGASMVREHLDGRTQGQRLPSSLRVVAPSRGDSEGRRLHLDRIVPASAPSLLSRDEATSAPRRPRDRTRATSRCMRRSRSPSRWPGSCSRHQWIGPTPTWRRGAHRRAGFLGRSRRPSCRRRRRCCQG